MRYCSWLPFWGSSGFTSQQTAKKRHQISPFQYSKTMCTYCTGYTLSSARARTLMRWRLFYAMHSHPSFTRPPWGSLVFTDILQFGWWLAGMQPWQRFPILYCCQERSCTSVLHHWLGLVHRCLRPWHCAAIYVAECCDL